ncbi:MAG: HAMP domain-containing histidine kinase [Patulibacter sp.]|nr:HAMP domain-containing histidine kinase [Patulibacter sp.]
MSWVVAAVALAVVAVSASAAWLTARTVMRASVDDALRAQASVVLDAKSTSRGMVLRARDGSGRLLFLPEPPARQGGPAEYAQTLAADGTIITTRGDVTLPVTAADLAAIAGGATAEPRDVRLGDAHLRILTVPLTGTAAAKFDAVAVQVGRPLNGVDDALRKLWIALLIVGALTVLAAVLVARAFARRTILRPVRDLAAAVEHVEQTADLDPRIPVHGDDELGDLTRHFNGMLDRLEGYRDDLRRSVAEQRNLVADASHELRTPVTSLRMNAELLLEEHDALSEPDRQAMLVAVRDQSDVLANLITDLIELARGDVPDERAEETIELDALVRECLENARRDHRGVDFRADLAAASVRGRRDRLARAVSNLLNNAALHGAAEGGPVEVSIARAGERAEIRVIDHGPGVPAAERERIFDRFRRGDDVRGRRGSGLGLAIVRQVARSHRGEVTVEDTPGGGATFVLRVPATSDAG